MAAFFLSHLCLGMCMVALFSTQLPSIRPTRPPVVVVVEAVLICYLYIHTCIHCNCMYSKVLGGYCLYVHRSMWLDTEEEVVAKWDFGWQFDIVSLISIIVLTPPFTTAYITDSNLHCSLGYNDSPSHITSQNLYWSWLNVSKDLV